MVKFTQLKALLIIKCTLEVLLKNLTFNTEGFDFVGVEGTYVAREQAQGTQYPIEIYFEGENHIEISKEFEISSRNKNAWVLGHPIFGQITCQPLSLEFDSTALNITKITGTLWESTEVKYPEYTINEKNQIELKRVAMTTAAFFFTATDVTETTQKSAFSLSDLIDIDYSKLPATNEQAVELKKQNTRSLVRNRRNTFSSCPVYGIFILITCLCY